MKFKYRYLRYGTSTLRQIGKFPVLEVRLAHGSNYIDLDCLVDSGAGDCLFSTDIADELEIDLTQADRKTYFGIAAQSVEGRIYPVRMRLKGFSEWVEVEAGFIPVDQIPLLGQDGLFDNYEVTFKGYRGRFEVKSRTHLHAGDKYLI